MSDSAGEITVDVGVGKESVTSFLAKLDAQLERSNTTMERFATELERRATSSQEHAAQGALTHASAQARLQAVSGNTAAAIRTMEAALKDLEPGTLAAVRAETQLVQLRTRLAKESAPAVSASKNMAASLLELAGPLGIATTATGALIAVAGRVKEGFDLRATLDEQRRGIGTLVGDVQKGNQIFQQAADFGRKYGFTQKEMGTSAAAAAPLIRTSTTAVEKQLEVLGRLASLNQAEGFQGAVFSTKELASGDITSIVERFNLARSAANQMKAEIASGKDVFQVLDAQLSKMGVTVDVLNNRTQGAAGAMRTYAQAQEDLTLAMGRFAEGPGQKMLDVLTSITNNVTKGLTIGDAITKGHAEALAGAKDYEAYRDAIVKANAALRESNGRGPAGASGALTEAQFNYAKALEMTGVAATEAQARARAFNDTLIQIGNAQRILKDDLGAGAQQIDAISMAMVRVGQSGAAGAGLVQGLTSQLALGTITADQAAAALAGFEQTLRAAHATTLVSADAEDRRTQAMRGSIIAQQASTAAAINDSAAKQAATAQAQLLEAQIQSVAQAYLALNPNIDAAGVASAVAAGKIDAAVGTYITMTLATQRARNELAALQAQAGVGAGAASVTEGRAERDRPGDLAQARAAGLAAARQRADEAAAAEARYQQALGNNGPAIKRANAELASLKKGTAAYYDKLTEIEQLEKKSSKGAGRGGTKLSDQQKLQNQLLSSQDQYQNKVEDAERQHADRVLQIQADFAERMRDAQDRLDQAQLDGRASFYANLGTIESDGIRAAASQQYEQAAIEAGQIAQEKGADVAEKYMQAQEQIISDRARRLTEIEKAQKDKDAGKAEYLKGVDQLQRNAEEARLAQIKAGKDSIAAQHEQQLADEEAKYTDSRQKIGLADDRATERLVTNAQRRGAALDVELLKAGQLADAYDRVAPAGGRTTTAAAPADQPAQPAAPAAPAATSGADITSALEAIKTAVGAVERAVRESGRDIEHAVSSNGGGMQ